MKIEKTIIGKMTLVAVMALMGCSGEHVAEPETTGGDTPSATEAPIAFSTGLPEEEAMTRADILKGLEEVLPDGNKKFKVWGYKNDVYDVGTGSYTSGQKIIDGYIVNWEANTAVTTASNSHDWEYVGINGQTIKFWDFSASAYRFFAYAPPTEPSPVTVGTSNPAEISFTAAVDASTQAGIDAAPYFSELWFSNDKVNDYGKPVTLKFFKPFARVRFEFIFLEGLTFGREKLSNIRFRPTVNADANPSNNQIIPTAGSVTVHYPLTGTGTTETWSVASTPAPTGVYEFLIDYYETPDPVPAGYPINSQPTSWPNTPENWYVVLPNTSQGSYTLQVAVVSDEIKTAVVPANFMQWKPGYEYTYRFKINEGGGITMDVIQVAINDWGNRQSSEHTVYNW